MLSPSRDDEDDDSHLCIKCNETIIGLDNYVKHRKERCGKKYDTARTLKTDIPSLDPLEPSYSLGADVFFQSLELQSSVKKPSLSRLTLPIPPPLKLQHKKQPLILPSSSRNVPRMSPLESNMRGEDWIGGHSLRIGNSEADNQTKLINAVASISGVAKKDPPTSYSIAPYNDFKVEEDSDEASDDSEDDDDDEPTTGGKWKPPPHHTGGKWRPASPDHDEWDMKDDQEPTGGKWKPLLADMVEENDDYDAPPPGHTKGKWIPGAQDTKNQIMNPTIQTKATVQYWCGPCNRRLGSRTIYEKHLLSNLHRRKILPENDLEFSGHMGPPQHIPEKRKKRPSKYTNNSIYQSQKNIKNIKEERPGKKKRKRKPYYVHCFGCKSRVRVHLMGKHLISHYHFRKTTNIRSPEYQQLILDNMDAIVRQSPFQCSPCKFYTNFLPNFMRHWFSREHQSKMDSMEGRYWCSFCKFECQSSQVMVQHMTSSEHNEVVAVINRSMPIIIRRRTIFECKTCSKEFRFNVEIKKHCKKTGHELANSATDLYQELHTCQHCDVKFRSSLTLAAHIKIKHKQKAFLCLVCSKSFQSSKEAVEHRQGIEHKFRRRELLKDRGIPTKDMSKRCPYCTDKLILKNVLELKQHIDEIHPERRKKCPKCGMSFTLSQEVSRHIRDNACQFSFSDQMSKSNLWNCSQCLFSADSKAECLFHEVLHNPPSTEIQRVGDKEKVVQKYLCPICPKAFRKSSLRFHIRMHTYERPFVCSVCKANFTRQSSLSTHSKVEHGLEMSTKINKIDEQLSKDSKPAIKTYFNKKKIMNNAIPLQSKPSDDQKIRRFKCRHEECNYVAATVTQLVKHRKGHGDIVKHHACPYCTFRTHQSSHMKRHMRCHAGDKPYCCPHCSFVCGSLENLRKHALTRNRHPGLFLYNCHDCAGAYRTNMATELRTHFLQTHNDKYDARSSMEASKTHLMKKT